MKKILLILLLLVTTKTYSQIEVGRLTLDKSYFITKVFLKDTCQAFKYTSKVGIKINEYEKPTIVIGFDVKFREKKYNPFAGFEINYGGYNCVYSRMLPKLRVGINHYRFNLFTENYYTHKIVILDTGQTGYQPIFHLCFGASYLIGDTKIKNTKIRYY